jgi:hypothetical protein
MERIDHARAQNGGVPDDESLAVLGHSLLRGRTRQEGGLWVIQILQGASPEQSVLAVRSEMVVKAGDEGIVIETNGRAESEAGIVKAVPYGVVIGAKFAGAECLVEVTGVID